MSKMLAVVAGGGIAISVVCLGFAAAIDDFSPGGLFSRCGAPTGDVGVNGTREIAWESDSDEVTINVPSTVTYRPGSGTMLIASCLTKRGELQPTSLSDYEDCHSGIHNDDGDLVLRRFGDIRELLVASRPPGLH